MGDPKNDDLAAVVTPGPVAVVPDPAVQPTLNGHETAALYGVAYWTLLEMAKRGDAPVAPLRLGRKLRWPTALVLQSLGIDAS